MMNLLRYPTSARGRNADQSLADSDESVASGVAGIDLKRVLRDLAKGRATKYPKDEVAAAVGRAHPASAARLRRTYVGE